MCSTAIGKEYDEAAVRLASERFTLSITAAAKRQSAARRRTKFTDHENPQSCAKRPTLWASAVMSSDTPHLSNLPQSKGNEE